jgi:hypothetical protein
MSLVGHFIHYLHSSLGRMRLFFAHITPRGQGNMYAQCERLIPVMNLDEFTNSLHGLSLSLFKVSDLLG